MLPKSLLLTVIFGVLIIPLAAQDIEPASLGEILVIVAEFDTTANPSMDPAEAFYTALTESFAELPPESGLRLRFARTNTLITDDTQARELSDELKATLVIWGRIDSSTIETFFELTPRQMFTQELATGTRYTAESEQALADWIHQAIDPLVIVNFTVAQFYVNTEQPDKALPLFENAIALAKEQPIARQRDMKLAALYNFAASLQQFDNRNYAKAIEYYSIALGLEPDEYQTEFAYFNRGLAYLREGMYIPAIEDYIVFVELRPDNVDAYFNRGLAYAWNGDYDRAIADYNKSLEYQPEAADIYAARGFAYYKKGDYEQAIADHTTAIDLQPDIADYYLNRGLAYYDTGDYDRAIEDNTTAVELKPKFADAYFNRAIAYREIGDYERAVEDYTTVIQLQPDNADACYYRGIVYYRANNYPSALESYDCAIQLNPDYAWVYFDRGGVRAITRNFEGAIADYEKAIELQFHLENAEVYMRLGNVYYQLRCHAEALAAYQQYVALTGEENVLPEILRRIQQLEAMTTPTPDG